MAILPPAEKLPLAIRKNVRDEWDSKKPELEKQISDIFGESWTIDINPLAFYPYAKEGDYAHSSLGDALKAWIEGAVYKLKYFIERYGEDGKNEVNSVASAHTISLGPDETGEVRYTGVDIHEGSIRMLFNPENSNSNIGEALYYFEEALNKAANPNPELSPRARLGISEDYKPKIDALQKKFATLFQKPDFVLNPNFEATYAALKPHAKDLREDWDRQLGYMAYAYFEGCEYIWRDQKFGEDEMLREGFLEAVEKAEVAVRVVEKLVGTSKYNEVLVEDGVVYLQTTPKTWDTNIAETSRELINLL